MKILIVLCLLLYVDALQTVNQENFLSIYFSKLWEVISSKFQVVKEFFVTEVPKFVSQIGRDVPKFVEDLHIKQEFEEKTEAIANATTKVKRYFADWDDKLKDTVDSFRFVFIIIVVLIVLSFVAYLYMECCIVRKLLLAIPKLVIHVVKQAISACKGKKKPYSNGNIKGHNDLCANKV